MEDASPTAKALLALELIQNSPGITGERLGRRLGVTDRAARRYVGILREAGIPIESTSGRYGGYRIGRGFRLPPLMFSTAEALGLMMAALGGHHNASDVTDPAGSALAKLVRVLPTAVAGPADAIRAMIAPSSRLAMPDPEITAAVVRGCTERHRLRLGYRRGACDVEPLSMDIDPWAVSVRHGRWYLLGWSHTRDAQRVLRIDRIVSAEPLPETFTPPTGLDPAEAVQDHLSSGWHYPVEIVFEANAEAIARCIPGSLGRLEDLGPDRSRLVGSTDEPDWYAERLAFVREPFHVVEPPELRTAIETLAHRLLAAAKTP
ncbi:helix-turn-helix transcriptional regulator [Kribbella sp. CA-253562]|uniref:helix-turn-helix transcriptional regulator n=1 Tax=Kribbella sp. CA-253562 TaxID=3239942 RepID=UPI003D8D234C